MQKIPLQQLQQRFSQLVQSGSSHIHEIETLGILNKAPLHVQQRFDIYQFAYNQRILENMEEDFPKIREILQKNLFSQLVQEYLKKYPSNYWSLAEVGKNFAQYILQSNWGIQTEYLSELAQFEWLQVLAGFVLIPEKFDFSTLANLEEDKQQKIVLQFDSSVHLFQSQWALHAENIFKQETFYAIFQNEGEVIYKNFSKLEWNILKKIEQKVSLGEITASLPDVQEADVTNLFSLLVANNIVTHFTL